MIRIRESNFGDGAQLAQLVEICFATHCPLEQYRWRHEHAPFRSTVFVAELGDAIVGSTTVDALPVWLRGRSGEVGRGAELMVDPGHRNQGISHAVRMRARVAQRSHPVSIHFPAEVSFLAARGEDSTMRRAGRLPQWVRWEQAGALRDDQPRIPSSVALAATFATRLTGRLSASIPGAISCQEMDAEQAGRFAAGLDELCERSKEIAPCLLRRGAHYINWRWLERPDPWRVVLAMRGHQVVDGYVAFRIVEGNCRIGDLLCLDPATMRCLLGAVGRLSAGAQPRRTLIELHDPRPWATRVLRLAGFLPRGLGPAISLKTMNPTVPSSFEALSSWYLTAGDTDLV